MECFAAYHCITNDKLNIHIAIGDSCDHTLAQGGNTFVRDPQESSLGDLCRVAGLADAGDSHLKT